MSNKLDIQSMWSNPPASFRSAPFWSWNGRLETGRLKKQIESMHAAGMGGFFMHSRYGLKTEYLGSEWFSAIEACIEKARELGMKAYLYDEDRWPSGDAGGIITREKPEFRTHLISAEKIQNPMDESKCRGSRLAVFSIWLDQKGSMQSYQKTESRGNVGLEQSLRSVAAAIAPNVFGKKDSEIIAFEITTAAPRPWENDGTYLDTLSADAVAEFVRVTHEEYAARFSNDFGMTIPAMFTDEPNYGHWFCGDVDGTKRLPWTPRLAEEFKTRRGYDIIEHLPELFFFSDKELFSKVRHDFYRTLTELFVENFAKQIGDWCEEHSLKLTGHVLWEWPLRKQIGSVGACMPIYEYMQWPGVDMLTDQALELAAVKQVSSVADQLGKERVLTELYGCTGWDWPLEGHKYIADWQFAAGANFLCPHLSHYSLAGGGKRDFPASIFDHSPWWKYYRKVQDYLGRLSLMLTQGEPVRDVLVLHPIESAWGVFSHNEENAEVENIQEGVNSIIYALTGAHYDWDFGDESILARHGRVEGGVLYVGKMRYKLIVLGQQITIRATTAALLEQFSAQGGEIIFVGSLARYIDGVASNRVEVLSRRGHLCDQNMAEFISMVESLLPRRISITENDIEFGQVWAMQRKIGTNMLVFLQSHDRKKAHTLKVSVPVVRPPVAVWDALNGERTLIPTQAMPAGVAFEIKLDASGSALVTIGIDPGIVKKASEKGNLVSVREYSGPFQVELTEPNTMPLDYCRFRFDDDEFSELIPTLKVDELIRARFGLETRLGIEQQPWYLYSKGAVDTKPRGCVEMEFPFHVTDVPGECLLAIENPQDYLIRVNGQVVKQVTGSWVDEEIKTLDIRGYLKVGDNQIQLTLDYRADIEIEDLYLVGNFGTAAIESGRPVAPGNVTLVPLPTKLALGSWVGQGLDFYTAGVRYTIPISHLDRGRHICVNLPDAACTAAAIHVGKQKFVLPWAPFTADITSAMAENAKEIVVEIIGGRKNILGPLHVPYCQWTGPECFSPNHEQWSREYQLNNHGLMRPVLLETWSG
ncbi:MAG: hypothetical protein A2Y07_10600 [Planctomycetes bacterium GWF2_50_10]|nr:MAG: hypothetical protein A2Y07_10600 [Planctomycetes bacterium GWF2_50_10]